MDNIFNQDELSADDQAVLRAFDELDMTGWEVGTSGAAQPPLADILSSEDLLMIFVGEAEEDMSIIRQALQQLEPDEHLDAARLQILQRTAHKMKGTSGAIGYTAMSTLAHYIEVLTRLIINGTLA